MVETQGPSKLPLRRYHLGLVALELLELFSTERPELAYQPPITESLVATSHFDLSPKAKRNLGQLMLSNLILYSAAPRYLDSSMTLVPYTDVPAISS